MIPSRRVFAAALSALLTAPPPALACLHGARSPAEAFQTGELSGSVRVEKLAAQYDGQSPNIVKLFVGPPGASLAIETMSEDALKRHRQLNEDGNDVLNPRPKMRGGGTPRSIGAPAAVATYETKSGIKAAIFDVTGRSWADIKARYRIQNQADDSHYEEWVKRVGPEEKRGLYAAVIDMSQPENRANANEALALSVRIPYRAGGADLQREVALDKWLEYKGTYDTPVIFATGWPKDAALNALYSVMANDWDLADDQATLQPKPSGSAIDVVVFVPKANLSIITFTVDDSGKLIYKNKTFKVGPHTVPQPKQRFASLPGERPAMGGPAKPLSANFGRMLQDTDGNVFQIKTK